MGKETTVFPLSGKGGNFQVRIRFNTCSSKEGSFTVLDAIRPPVTSPLAAIVNSIIMIPFKVGLFLNAFL